MAKKISGHKTDSAYIRYAIVDNRDIEDAGKKLGGVFEGAGMMYNLVVTAEQRKEIKEIKDTIHLFSQLAQLGFWGSLVVLHWISIAGFLLLTVIGFSGTPLWYGFLLVFVVSTLWNLALKFVG